MRTTGKRSVVLYILLAAFVAGIVWFVVSFFINGGKWAMQPYNQHLGSSSLGKITDRDGVMLAETEDGVRVYSESETVRRSLLHTIGDTDGMISTSVQSTMRSRLSGYNIITGVNDIALNMFDNLKLTISAEVNAAAYNALGSRNGAVMVYDYKNGDVICKVSKPTYDPMNIPDNLLDDPSFDGVFLDKNLSQRFVPGSTFKIVTQAAAIEMWPDSWQSREYTCTGSVELSGTKLTCLGVHGTVGPYSAMGQSCNVYYALLANDVGKVALQNKADQMGFNTSQGFGTISCEPSYIDITGDINDNQLGWAGVGQYTTLANPYHMMVLMGAVANGGTYTEPRITTTPDLLGAVTSGSRNLMSASEAATLKDMMRNTVENYYGDWLFPSGMEICAKSGTAEIDGKSPTCWFVGFSQNSSSPYAFVVMIEEGVGGMETAGNAAAEIMSAVWNAV